MKKWIPVIAAILALCIAAGILIFNTNFLIADGQILARNATQLDLSGQQLTEPERLHELTGLESLNLRDTGLTASQYDALQAALPNCRIDWSVPFQGSHYPQDTTCLTITSLSQEDIDQLAYFPELKAVDATGCTDYPMLLRLKEAYPNAELSYALNVDAKQLPQDTTHLVLGGGTLQELTDALTYLPDLQSVDATGCTDYAALEVLKQQYPNCDITYTVDLGSVQAAPGTTELTLENPDLRQLEAVLPYLPEVKNIALTGIISSNDAVHALQKAYPDITFNWSFQLCGVTVNSLDTLVNLSGIPMESTQEVENALKYFHNLERVEMCDCGISDEEMDALSKRNPDIRFVWTVSIGPLVRLRTDATYFMPYQYGATLTDKDTPALKYCIDLICLDLGHQDIKDISFLTSLTKVKYLILGDTSVSDISPLAGMEELIYCELFMTRVRDFSPLKNCKNLQDLNVCYTVFEDVSPLYEMKQLKNLWIKGLWDMTMRNKLVASLTDTHIVFSNDNKSSTADGWRKLQNYYDMRDILGMYYTPED